MYHASDSQRIIFAASGSAPFSARVSLDLLRLILDSLIYESGPRQLKIDKARNNS